MRLALELIAVGGMIVSVMWLLMGYDAGIVVFPVSLILFILSKCIRGQNE